MDIQFTDEEKDGVVAIRDGEPYLILGTGKTYIHAIYYEKGWEPPHR